MPEENEQKLGTSVTFMDPDDTRKPVQVAGVYLEPGKSLDLAEYMDQGKAEKLAKKLSTNPYFQVEGGPDLSQEIEEREQRRFEQEQRIHETYQRQQEARRPRAEVDEREPEAPQHYKAPESNQLEGENAPRTAPDKRSSKKG